MDWRVKCDGWLRGTCQNIPSHVDKCWITIVADPSVNPWWLLTGFWMRGVLHALQLQRLVYADQIWSNLIRLNFASIYCWIATAAYSCFPLGRQLIENHQLIIDRNWLLEMFFPFSSFLLSASFFCFFLFFWFLKMTKSAFLTILFTGSFSFCIFIIRVTLCGFLFRLIDITSDSIFGNLQGSSLGISILLYRFFKTSLGCLCMYFLSPVCQRY